MAGLDDQDAVRDFIARHGLDGFPHLYDPDGSIWQGFGTITRSAFIFVNDDGTMERTSFGVLGEAAIDRRIDDLIAR